MRLQICHRTHYDYGQSVHFLQHLLFLRPRESPMVSVRRFDFSLPPEARLDWITDDFDNVVGSLHSMRNAKTLTIVSDSEVYTSDVQPFDFLIRDYAISFPFDYEPLHRHNLGIYFGVSGVEDERAVDGWLNEHFAQRPSNTLACLVALNGLIHQKISYQRREEPGIQSPAETLALSSGSCRDYAVLLIACLQRLGLAARFVSGYLFDPLSTADTGAGDMHAWTEVYLPGAGWRGMDASHGKFCDQMYVPVAHAVVPESVNPVQGAYQGGGPATLSVEVSVRQLP